MNSPPYDHICSPFGRGNGRGKTIFRFHECQQFQYSGRVGTTPNNRSLCASLKTKKKKERLYIRVYIYICKKERKKERIKMKDPPPVFSPASQSVTLPSLKSGWRFIKRETEQANKTTDRPFLPTLLSQDRGRERNSSVVHFFFFFSLLSAKERKLFLMNTENETKEKERKKELKFIQRYYEMHRRRSP